MLKKIILTSLITIVTASSVLADDFHRLYVNKFANSIKSYRFEELNRIPVKIKIMNDVTTKKNLVEGQKLVFLTTESVVLTHKKVLPEGSRIFGTVETISQNEMMGIPSNLIIGNFKIEYMPTIKLEGQIVKQGANRAIWVRPLAPILFAVRGGHAKIKNDETYTLYYTPPEL